MSKPFKFKSNWGSNYAEKIIVSFGDGQIFDGLRVEGIVGLGTKELQIHNREGIQSIEGIEAVKTSKETRIRGIERDSKVIRQLEKLHTTIQGLYELGRQQEHETYEVQFPRQNECRLAYDRTVGDSETKSENTIGTNGVQSRSGNGTEKDRTETDETPRHKERIPSDTRQRSQMEDDSSSSLFSSNLSGMVRPQRDSNRERNEVQPNSRSPVRVVDLATVREARSVQVEEQFEGLGCGLETSGIPHKPPYDAKVIRTVYVGTLRGQVPTEIIGNLRSLGHKADDKIHSGRVKTHEGHDRRISPKNVPETDYPVKIEFINRFGPINLLDKPERYAKGLVSYFYLYSNSDSLKDFRKKVIVP
jgi:hypothetical protein